MSRNDARKAEEHLASQAKLTALIDELVHSDQPASPDSIKQFQDMVIKNYKHLDMDANVVSRKLLANTEADGFFEGIVAKLAGRVEYKPVERDRRGVKPDYLIPIFANLLNKCDSKTQQESASANIIARVTKALGEIEIDILKPRDDTINPTLEKARSIFLARRTELMFSKHEYALHAIFYMELLRTSVRSLDMFANGDLRSVPACDDPAAAPAFPLHKTELLPMEGQTSFEERRPGAAYVYIATTFAVLDGSASASADTAVSKQQILDILQVEILDGMTIDALCRNTHRRLCIQRAIAMFVSPGHDDLDNAFRREEKVQDLHNAKPSTPDAPWIAWQSSSEVWPSTLLKARVPAINRNLPSRTPSQQAIPAVPQQGKQVPSKRNEPDTPFVAEERPLTVSKTGPSATPRSGRASQMRPDEGLALTPATSDASKTLAFVVTPAYGFKAMPVHRQRELTHRGLRGADAQVDSIEDVFSKERFLNHAACTLHGILLQEADKANNEYDVESWFSTAMQRILKFLPPGSVAGKKTFGEHQPDHITMIVDVKDGEPLSFVSITTEAKMELLKEHPKDFDIIAFLNNPANSGETIYKNVSQALSYALIARCRFCILTYGRWTFVFEIVHDMESGGIEVLVAGPKLCTDRCDDRESTSIMAMVAGMAFELREMLVARRLTDRATMRVALNLNGDPGDPPHGPGSGSSSSGGQDSPQSSRDGSYGSQAPRGDGAGNGSGSGSSASGAAFDLGCAPGSSTSGAPMDLDKTSETVRQDSGICVKQAEQIAQAQFRPLQHRFPVVITNGDSSDLRAVGEAELRSSSEWGLQLGGLAYLVIGQRLNKRATRVVRVAEIGNQPAVAKYIPLEQLAAFETELSSYNRLAHLQGGPVARLHTACMYDGHSALLVVERGAVCGHIGERDKQLAIEALKEIHNAGALHGDVHAGNVAFAGVGDSRRAFWIDLERTTFPDVLTDEAKGDEIIEFERLWREYTAARALFG
ncbi:hypothetical protein HK105_201051 [Polyrhizophydium stewartii]|uniref:Protein kinase domain-containing protein n=1 Tax=Polyrhizophydium stewartii TaxID=2732419 RepID=A0ABR4NIS4_9FUNG